MRWMRFLAGLFLTILASSANAVVPTRWMQDANLTATYTDTFIATQSVFTSPHTITLPPAGNTCQGQTCIPYTLTFTDARQTITGVNTLTFQTNPAAPNDTINGTTSLTVNTPGAIVVLWPVSGFQWVAQVVQAGTFLLTTNNLSDLTNVGTARTNLGLSALATQIPGTGVAAALGINTNATGGFPTVPVGVSQGGSGATTLSAHGVVLGEGTSAFATANPGTAGRVLTDNGGSADPTFQSQITIFNGMSTSALTQNTTNFCGPAACSPGGAGTNFSFVRSGTVKNLFIASSVAPAAGQTFTATFYNGATTALTCTISNPSTSCNDTTHTVSIGGATGSYVQVVLSATSGSAAFTYGFEYDVP